MGYWSVTSYRSRSPKMPAPVLYAESRQINAIAPIGLAANGTMQVTVTYNNQQFGPAVAKAIFGNPEIFRLQFGQSAQAVAINQDGTLNGPTNPAARGSIVAVWGTGYGQTNPACPTGGLNVPHIRKRHKNDAPSHGSPRVFEVSLVGDKRTWRVRAETVEKWRPGRS